MKKRQQSLIVQSEPPPTCGGKNREVERPSLLFARHNVLALHRTTVGDTFIDRV